MTYIILCRARQELSSDYFIADIGFDKAERKPFKVILNRKGPGAL
jgi:hypothetical protein